MKQRFYQPRAVNFKTALGFGATDLLGGSAYAIVAAWLLFFFTQYTDLSATEAAGILVIAKFFDAVFSIFIGYLSDNLFKFKIGKKFGRRHFLMLLGIPLVLEYVAIWQPNHNYWYYLITYVFFELVVSLVLIPWETLPTEMTTDYHKRSLLSTVRLIISELATFLATMVPRELFRIFGDNSPMPFILNSIIFSFIFALAIFISWRTTWESKPTTETINLQRFSLKSLLLEYRDAFKIRVFRQHLMIYLASYSSMDVWNAVFVYFITINLGLPTAVAAEIQSINIISIPMTALFGLLIVKKGPKWIYHISYILISISSLGWLAIWLYHPNHLWWFLISVGFIYQIGRAGMVYTPWNVFSFIPDVDEIISGKKRAGSFTSLMTFIRKSTSSIGTLLVGVILDKFGYINKTTNQPHSVHIAIVGLLVGGVITLIILAWLFVRQFKLTFDADRLIQLEIARVQNGGHPADVAPQVGKLIEDLSGQSYPPTNAPLN
ncbi:MFS transporter [Periweissella beninensis]|uniref:MFS transporter n=1 Tax=Periweissella beninensis TaxID=504936 RepID=A0ABT0VGA7_9LACO|nr:MFS transporter [Periweissella beninensis]MBM7543753.1 oligogalacturonide transporter [Periweissella beninensis]MCM2436863.1 MFS transporter [Periweissella beninensis]MCT4396457.1 MFS transporter [Periweissella beninensis]